MLEVGKAQAAEEMVRGGCDLGTSGEGADWVQKSGKSHQEVVNPE